MVCKESFTTFSSFNVKEKTNCEIRIFKSHEYFSLSSFKENLKKKSIKYKTNFL